MAQDKKLLRKMVQKDASTHLKKVRAKFLRNYQQAA